MTYEQTAAQVHDYLLGRTSECPTGYRQAANAFLARTPGYRNNSRMLTPDENTDLWLLFNYDLPKIWRTRHAA